MRIASVLHDGSPQPDGAPLPPTVALERDGALYRVTELARAFGPKYADLQDETDFHHTVIALRAEPLRELDERLKSGERPSAARILPGKFTWLPPCDPQRATLVKCAPCTDTVGNTPPSFSLGSARLLVGHEATVPLPLGSGSEDLDGDRKRTPEIDAGLAVVLGDDLHAATSAEAERAILGFTLLLDWKPGLWAHLGPVLVTRDELKNPTSLRAVVRSGAAARSTEGIDPSPYSPSETIAWISHHLPLQAGDVIGLGRLRSSASAPEPQVTIGDRFELVVERIGRLSGRPVCGPAPDGWRAR